MTATAWTAVGAAAAWVAALVSVVVMIRSIKAERAARTDADRSARALERMADAQERATSQPPVQFQIRKRDGRLYVVRNVGTHTATGVHFVNAVRDVEEGPDHIDLAPGQGSQFFLLDHWGRPPTTEMAVACEQLPKPVMVAIEE